MILIIGIIISILAGTFQLLGYFIYNRQIFTGKTVPNTASWLIWAYGGTVTTASYIFVSGDWVKNILPIVCSLSAIIIFVYCVAKGRFERIDLFDWTVIILDIGITVYWFFSKEPFFINVLYLLSACLSFIPIIRYVWKNPLSENATPWVLWSIAYLMMGATVILRYEKWQDMLYPLVLFLLDVIVAILASDYLVKRKKNKNIRFETAIDNI